MVLSELASALARKAIRMRQVSHAENIFLDEHETRSSLTSRVWLYIHNRIPFVNYALIDQIVVELDQRQLIDFRLCAGFRFLLRYKYQTYPSLRSLSIISSSSSGSNEIDEDPSVDFPWLTSKTSSKLLIRESATLLCSTGSTGFPLYSNSLTSRSGQLTTSLKLFLYIAFEDMSNLLLTSGDNLRCGMPNDSEKAASFDNRSEFDAFSRMLSII